MKVCEVLERVFANDIRVEDEERAIVFSEDLLSKLERTSCTKGFGFNREFDLDIVLFLILLSLSVCSSHHNWDCPECLHAFFRAEDMMSGR